MVKTAIALGTFDGVHTGHLSVINAAVNSGFKPIAVAFPEPPKGIISGKREILTPPTEKKELLTAAGISEVFYLDFQQIKDTPPKAFLEFLVKEFNPAVISCGFNYRFGKNGGGDADFASRFCNTAAIELKKAVPVCVGDKVISSTYIRELLLSGEISQANSFLSRPFGFSGMIIHGDERGRTIGFPTINQVYHQNRAKVRYGVYKTAVTVQGKQYSGITNIGERPTFKNGIISAETYINGFSGDIYGQLADIRLLDFIRDERKFTSLEELKRNIESDLSNLID